MAGSGADFKPAFQVEKLEGTFYRMVMHIEEDVRMVGPNANKPLITRKLIPKREEFEGGYMIYFPQGHSMFIASDDLEQLRRIGVLEQPRLVDMNSGEEVPQGVNLSPKEIVQMAGSKRGRPSKGGLTEIMAGDL